MNHYNIIMHICTINVSTTLMLAEIDANLVLECSRGMTQFMVRR